MTGHNLRVVSDGAGDVVVVALDGEIDVSNARAVGEELLSTVPHDAIGLTVDCTLLRYVDSAGVSMFFELIRRLEVVRRQLALHIPNGSPLRRLFEITGVHEAATVGDSIDECLDGIRAKASEGLG